MKNAYLFRSLVAVIMTLVCSAVIANASCVLKVPEVLFSIFFIAVNAIIMISSFIDRCISEEKLIGKVSMAAFLNIIMCIIISKAAIVLGQPYAMWALTFSCIITGFLMFDSEQFNG